MVNKAGSGGKRTIKCFRLWLYCNGALNREPLKRRRKHVWVSFSNPEIGRPQEAGSSNRLRCLLCKLPFLEFGPNLNQDLRQPLPPGLPIRRNVVGPNATLCSASNRSWSRRTETFRIPRSFARNSYDTLTLLFSRGKVLRSAAHTQRSGGSLSSAVENLWILGKNNCHKIAT
jgi:hypothetical protein